MGSLRRINSKGFKDFHQKRLDEKNFIANQKLQEEKRILKEKKRQEEINEIAERFKYNWRDEIDLQESDWSPVAGSGPTNSTSQTFSYSSPNFETGEPNTFTVSGLGGVESIPSTVTVDYGFGETEVVSAPTYNQLALAGYAKPMGLGVQRRQDQTENERIDAEIRKLEEQIQKLTQQQNDLGEEYLATEPQYTGMTYAEYVEKDNELGQKWGDKMWPLQKKLKYECGPDQCKGIAATLVKMSEQMIKEHEDLYNQYKNQTDAFAKTQDTHRAAYEKKYLAFETQKDALKAKIAELEKQRPINQQLDASQQVYPNLPLMNARVGSAVGANLVAQVPPDISPYLDSDGKPNMDALRNADAETFGKVFNYLKNKTPKTPTVLPDIVPPEDIPNIEFTTPRKNQNMPSFFPFDTSKMGGELSQVASTDLRGLMSTQNNVVTTNDEKFIRSLEILPKGVNNVMSGWGFAGDMAIRYAKGDYTPITRSPGYNFDRRVLELIRRSDTPGAVQDKVYTDNLPSGPLGAPRAFGDLPVRLSLGQFNYDVTPNGIRIRDTFNFNANRSIGALSSLGLGIGQSLQNTADRLVDIGNKRARSRGLNPDNDSFGIPINYTIPWSEVPADLQNKLDPYQRIVPINKKKTQNKSTTWNRIQKYR